jgi:hypothetical protein
MHILLYTALAIVTITALFALSLLVYGKFIPVAHVTAVEITLKRSAQEVYDLVADVPGHARWAPRVRSVTPAPPHDGMPAYRMAVDRQEFFFYVSAAEPPRSFTLTVPGDRMFSGTWTWDITPAPGGCTVRLTERGEVYAAFVRGMLRVLGMEARFLLLNLSGMAKHFGEGATPRRVA